MRTTETSHLRRHLLPSWHSSYKRFLNSNQRSRVVHCTTNPFVEHSFIVYRNILTYIFSSVQQRQYTFQNNACSFEVDDASPKGSLEFFTATYSIFELNWMDLLFPELEGDMLLMFSANISHCCAVSLLCHARIIRKIDHSKMWTLKNSYFRIYSIFGYSRSLLSERGHSVIRNELETFSVVAGLISNILPDYDWVYGLAHSGFVAAINSGHYNSEHYLLVIHYALPPWYFFSIVLN